MEVKPSPKSQKYVTAFTEPEELKLMLVGLLKHAGCGDEVNAATGELMSAKLRLIVSLHGAEPPPGGIEKAMSTLPVADAPH